MPDVFQTHSAYVQAPRGALRLDLVSMGAAVDAAAERWAMAEAGSYEEAVSSIGSGAVRVCGDSFPEVSG